jgi:uncharacterized membrane protein YphA (DoxX/SURF4 family)
MIVGLAIQQIFYVTFRPVILPPWPSSLPGYAIGVYLFSAYLIVTGIAIIIDKKARTASLILGGILLVLFLFCQIPYEIIADPNNKNLGTWTSALKELALSGGAFIVAGSFSIRRENGPQESSITSLLEKIIPFGSIFFSIMLICFGTDHFLFTKWIATLVPNWIPFHIFWACFAGVALIGSGIAIIFKIKLKLTAILLAIMIFLWFILLHIPRGIADPYSLQGNEISSVLESFGFSGIAYLMAYGYHVRKS